MKKLNDEQRQLITENHKLIYGFMSKYNLSAEDYYMICAYALVKAAAAYDGTSKFSTYAYSCMKNQVKTEWRTQGAKCRSGNTTSLNQVVMENGSDGSSLTLEDMVEDPKDLIADTETRLALQQWAQKLDDTQRSLLYLVLDNKTQKEISRLTGISQPQISRRIKALKTQLQLLIEFGG